FGETLQLRERLKHLLDGSGDIDALLQLHSGPSHTDEAIDRHVGAAARDESGAADPAKKAERAPPAGESVDEERTAGRAHDDPQTRRPVFLQRSEAGPRRLAAALQG